MIKIYEALISFRIGAWSINCTDTAQSVKNLFKGYTRLVEFTKVTNARASVFRVYCVYI